MAQAEGQLPAVLAARRGPEHGPAVFSFLCKEDETKGCPVHLTKGEGNGRGRQAAVPQRSRDILTLSVQEIAPSEPA